MQVAKKLALFLVIGLITNLDAQDRNTIQPISNNEPEVCFFKDETLLKQSCVKFTEIFDGYILSENEIISAIKIELRSGTLYTDEQENILRHIISNQIIPSGSCFRLIKYKHIEDEYYRVELLFGLTRDYKNVPNKLE